MLGTLQLCFFQKAIARSAVLLHLLYEKRKNSAAVTTVFTFFHQNSCGVNKKVHFFAVSI